MLGIIHKMQVSGKVFGSLTKNDILNNYNQEKLGNVMTISFPYQMGKDIKTKLKNDIKVLKIS